MDEFAVNFVYNYLNYDGSKKTISYPIPLPFKNDIKELCHYIIKENCDEMMIFLDEHESRWISLIIKSFCKLNIINKLSLIEMLPSLKSFITDQNQKFYDDRDENLLLQAISGELDTERFVKNLERQYRDEVLEFADRIGPTDEEIFAESFHRLIHMPVLPEILHREKSFAAVVSDTAQKMDQGLQMLISQQENEIKNKLQELDVSATSEV